MDRLGDRVKDGVLDRLVDDAGDARMGPGEFDRMTDLTKTSLDAVDDVSRVAGRAAGVAGLIKTGLDKTAAHTNLMGADEVSPNPTDNFAAAHYNNFVASDAIAATHPGNRFEVRPRLFSGSCDELVNLSLQHTSRMTDPEMRGEYFERINDMVERHSGHDKNSINEETEKRFRDASEKLDFDSNEKLDFVETKGREEGFFNPEGNGQLFLVNGKPAVGERMGQILKAEAEAEAAYAALDPVQRAAKDVGLLDRSDGEVTLTPDAVREQLAVGYPEVMAHPDYGKAFGGETFRENLEATVGECESKGVEEFGVHYRVDADAVDRTVDTMRSVNELGREHECESAQDLAHEAEEVARDLGIELPTPSQHIPPMSQELEGYSDGGGLELSY